MENNCIGISTRDTRKIKHGNRIIYKPLLLIIIILYKRKIKCRVKIESMSEQRLRQRLKCELFTQNAVLRNIGQIRYDTYHTMGEYLLKYIIIDIVLS